MSTARPTQSRRVAVGASAGASSWEVIAGPSVVGGGRLTHSTNGTDRIRHRRRRNFSRRSTYSPGDRHRPTAGPAARGRGPRRADAVALERERVRRRAPADRRRDRHPPARRPVGAERGQQPAVAVLRLRARHGQPRAPRRHPQPGQLRLGAAGVGRLRDRRARAHGRGAGRAGLQRLRPARRRPGRGAPHPAGPGDGAARPPVRRVRPRRPRPRARRTCHPPAPHRHRGGGAGRPGRRGRAHGGARPPRPGAQAAGGGRLRRTVRGGRLSDELPDGLADSEA